MTRARTVVGTAAAVAATAGVGSLATDPRSPWYLGLDKPAWQPPGPAFGIVWSALYTGLAATSAQVLGGLADDGRTEEAAAFRRELAANLVLNAGWSLVFFGARRPRPAVPVAALLAVSSARLARRAGRAGRARGLALAPYAAWTAFATVLNAEIARRNPGR